MFTNFELLWNFEEFFERTPFELAKNDQKVPSKLLEGKCNSKGKS